MDEPPHSTDDGFMVAIASSRGVAQKAPVPRWRLRLWLAGSLVSALGTLAFVALATQAYLRDRSLDVPGKGNVRLGFYGNRGLTRWVCGEGHEHLSAPFWLGALVLILLTVWLTRRWFSSRARNAA